MRYAEIYETDDIKTEAEHLRQIELDALAAFNKEKTRANIEAVWAARKARDRRPITNESVYTAYHGTDNQFDDFDEKYIGTGLDASPFVGGVGMLGKGFYFTPSKRKAADFGKHVMAVKLTLNNPLVVGKGAQFDTIYNAMEAITGREVYRADFQPVLRKAGYDGIIRRDGIILSWMSNP